MERPSSYSATSRRKTKCGRWWRMRGSVWAAGLRVQQRRRGPGRRADPPVNIVGLPGGDLGSDAGHEPQGSLSLSQVRDEADDEAGPGRRDRQHAFGGRGHAGPDFCAYNSQQGGPERPYQVRGVGGRAVRHTCQRGLPGPIQNTLLWEYLTGIHAERLGQIVDHLPLRRVGLPEDVAETVLWLCSDTASFITGQCVLRGIDRPVEWRACGQVDEGAADRGPFV